MYRGFFKRFIDILISLTGLIVLSPVFLILVFLLTIANNGKPFFFQKRPGKKEKLFKLIKFRTMTDMRDKEGNLLPDILRLTRIGSFVRKTSLDEMPQLLNVLKGEMSLIGPRPLLIEYLPLYNDDQRKRHEVKPGITGWAQVNGRNAISWEDKFKHDLYYVNRVSFILDIKIAILTIRKVILAKDINSSETITMEKFGGSK